MTEHPGEIGRDFYVRRHRVAQHRELGVGNNIVIHAVDQMHRTCESDEIGTRVEHVGTRTAGLDGGQALDITSGLNTTASQK